jgi:signal transduction histidine kinase
MPPSKRPCSASICVKRLRFGVIVTLELLKASLPTGVRLQSRIDAGNAAVVGDATYLHQLVMNLCTNAIQAMELGGLLSVVLELIDG